MNFLYKGPLYLVLAYCVCLPLQAAPNRPIECAGNLLRTNFESSANWSMCITLDKQEGLTINQLKYSVSGIERRVLSKASLSQLETVFDDNRQAPTFAISKEGLGETKLITLDAGDCEGGDLYPDSTGRKVVCARTEKNNLLYNYAYQNRRQGAFFEVRSISQATAFQTYTQRWRFYESGVIEPAIGFGGKIPRFAPSTLGFGRPIKNASSWALGFSSYLGWRLDFDLGRDSSNDIVEEITSTPSPSRRQKSLNIEALEVETARTLNPELKTTWRVKDNDEINASGLAISYELIPSHYYQSANNVRGRPWLANDIYFTRYRDCEKYSSANAKTAGCSRNVLQYTQNKESIYKADVVVWYKQGYHYLPRSDDSDYLSTDWVGFQLMPRDWTANNPL